MQKKSKRGAHRSYRIEKALRNQCLLQASLVAFPAALVATAHRRPRPINMRTAAAEQQVVVQLVLLRRHAARAEHPRRSAFDGDDDGRIIWRREHMPPEPVRVRIPPKRIRLYKLSAIGAHRAAG